MKASVDNFGDRLRRRKWQELSLIVPILAVLLLLPPFISVFSLNISAFGIPLIVLYIFIVWIVLIVATRFLAQKLMRDYESNLPGKTRKNGSDIAISGS